MHIAFVEISIVLSTIIPFHFSSTMLQSVMELSSISSNSWEMLFSFTIRLSISPLSFISHSVEFIKESSFSIKLSVLEFTIVIRSIGKNMNSFSFCFTIYKVGLNIGTIDSSSGTSSVLFSVFPFSFIKNSRTMGKLINWELISR